MWTTTCTKSRFAVLFLAAVAVLLAPRGAAAQSAIAGQVTDATGAVLPGVTVEAASPALIEGSRTTGTDTQGRYTIENLRPGTYKVSFSLTGFSTTVREGIELETCQVSDPNKLRFCDEQPYDTPWNSQAKISAAYPLPWGVSASMVFQSLPGAVRVLTYIVTRAQVPNLTLPAVTIGPTTANPSNGLNTPGTLYYPRLNQLDLKFSKAIKVSTLKIEPQLGIFNVANAATILSQNNTFGPSLDRVQQILDGRLVQIGVQVDF